MTAIRKAATAAFALALTAAVAQAQTYPTGKDPRNGLKSGVRDAGVAIEGMRQLSFTSKAAEFDTAVV